MIRLTLTVAWNQERNQYEAYCHECRTIVQSWSAEWMYRSNMRGPKQHQHDCPAVKLINLGPINPHQDFYEPTTTKENK